MVEVRRVLASLLATAKALLSGGSPFAGYTAMWPTNEEGKYVIEAEGIRLAFTNLNGGAPTNLWMNDTNGNEVDILLGLPFAKDYANYTGLLGGTIGQYSALATTVTSERLTKTSIQAEWLVISAGRALRSTRQRTATMAPQRLTVESGAGHGWLWTSARTRGTASHPSFSIEPGRTGFLATRNPA